MLGRNGAGKSTLLNIISNRIIPTAGEVIIDLEPAAENSRAQQKIFHMHSVQMYPENMKVKEAFIGQTNCIRILIWKRPSDMPMRFICP